MKVVQVNDFVFDFSSYKGHSSRKQMSNVRDALRSRSLQHNSGAKQSSKQICKPNPELLVACTTILKPGSVDITNYFEWPRRPASVLPRLNHMIENNSPLIKSSQSPKRRQQSLDGRISPEPLAATIEIRFHNPNEKQFSGSCQSGRSRNWPASRGQFRMHEQANITSKIDITQGISDSRFLRKRLKRFAGYDFDITELKKG